MPGRYMISGPEGNGLKINSQKILQPLNEARAAISPCGASLLPTESRNWRYQPHRVQSSPKRDGNCHGVTQRSRAEKTSQFELADKKQIQPQDTQPWRSAQPIPTVEPADRFAHGCKSTSPDRPIWATLFPEAGSCMILLHDPDLPDCRFGRRLFLRPCRCISDINLVPGLILILLLHINYNPAPDLQGNVRDSNLSRY